MDSSSVSLSGFVYHIHDDVVDALQLVDTKSKDKHSNVMHYVVKTMQEHYPDCVDFASEFTAVQKASTGL
jgi:hypothetical protein